MIQEPEKTHRPYHNPKHLLKIYRWMEAYEQEHEFKPSIAEMVTAKLAGSTSVIRYQLDHMERFGLIRQPTITIKGREIVPSRSIILLPLDEAAFAIHEILEKETSHEQSA